MNLQLLTWCTGPLCVPPPPPSKLSTFRSIALILFFFFLAASTAEIIPKAFRHKYRTKPFNRWGEKRRSSHSIPERRVMSGFCLLLHTKVLGNQQPATQPAPGKNRLQGSDSPLYPTSTLSLAALTLYLGLYRKKKKKRKTWQTSVNSILKPLLHLSWLA